MMGSSLEDGLARRHAIEARSALDDLALALDLCLDELGAARRRAGELAEQHDNGRSWTAIVTAEDRPLIVERITTALSTLAASGSRWRRAQALALHAEGASINHIAALFRVTRQRVSALINGPAR
jgi:Homeodomain-like domain-containing protein